MGWEPLPGHEEPRGVADSLRRLERLIGTARPDSITALGEHWEQVIGRRLAMYCELHSLHHGTLVVSCSDGGVAEQLRWMSTDLVGAANAVLGCPEVTSVEVRMRAG